MYRGVLSSLIGQALSICERTGSEGLSDPTVGSLHLKRWLDSPAFLERSGFEHFLQSNHLTEESLVRYLGLTQRGATPRRRFAILGGGHWSSLYGLPKAMSKKFGVGAYLNAVQPLLVDASARLLSEVNSLNSGAGYQLIGLGVLEPLIDALRRATSARGYKTADVRTPRCTNDRHAQRGVRLPSALGTSQTICAPSRRENDCSRSIRSCSSTVSEFGNSGWRQFGSSCKGQPRTCRVWRKRSALAASYSLHRCLPATRAP